jgi:coenzyme F420-reducing hydrogenase delta subunit/NAD-dependent dihydropyrimidine dehydrogenase PreA subunit
VCGAAHYPCDAARATFEAYSAAARAAQHIQRKQITSWAPPAVVDATRCNGCGDCVKVCPFMAVTLESRPGDKASMPPLAVVDALVCTGCGNCVSVCPVKAAQVATTIDEQIEAQILAALNAERGTLIFACEWSGYSAAEIAGTQQLAYPASTRIIRLNCTGRLQPGLILKALEMGAAGVLILGCAPGVCHFEQGNERCAAVFEQASTLARLLAMDDRLRLEWIPPDDGARFVQVVNDFVAGIRDHE